ncbi:UNVERIFIED_CONTAM: hypothetical protein B566_EDAN018719 [Ephemera danica]|nr:hypothetical protein B566_EDAN018719 [Ephemera danica]
MVAIPGDVGEEGLGLSDADRKRLMENVSIVFHSAATLDFEASLLPAVQINLRGTRAIVRLCQQMPKLKVLLHVSSAYVNCVRSETTEQFYEWFVFHLILSVCATVTAALKEPVPGWISSTNGPSGFLMGAARGVVRRLPMGAGLIYDYIPVDMVINEMLVAACNTGTNNLIQEELPTLLHKYPLKGAVWYPNLKMLHSLSHFRLSSIFVHFFPAYLGTHAYTSEQFLGQTAVFHLQ